MAHHSVHDWLMIGTIVLAMVFLFSFMQQRTAAGQVIGGNVELQCVTLAHAEPVSITTSRLYLCANQIHSVEYFELHAKETIIDCAGSTLQGNGGALLVARVTHPTVTLRNCQLNGFEGLYSSQNPVTVKVELN